MTDDLHITAHEASCNHREQVMASELCGCFYCLDMYPPSEIEEWVDEGSTALCPRCGIDSVLGSASGVAIDAALLRRMRAHWFETTSELA